MTSIHDRAFEVRFWDKVVVHEGKCWEWTACIVSGYGRIKRKGKDVQAHRVSWEIHNGKIPKTKWVLHKCDNRQCCNPKHLFIGTHQDNMDDMDRKGRRHSQVGVLNSNVKLTEADVVEIRDAKKKDAVTDQELGERYGVTRAAVSQLLRGERWTCVNS